MSQKWTLDVILYYLLQRNPFIWSQRQIVREVEFISEDFSSRYRKQRKRTRRLNSRRDTWVVHEISVIIRLRVHSFMEVIQNLRSCRTTIPYHLTSPPPPVFVVGGPLPFVLSFLELFVLCLYFCKRPCEFLVFSVTYLHFTHYSSI